MSSTILFTLVAVCLTSGAWGHGMLHEPPGRATAWRHGFDTPVNHQDNELFCGGFQHQWYVNGGKCGICGDSWDGPREHEAGGKYATGTIVRTYTPGQVIDVYAQITANHLGYLEWRLCPNNDVTKPATQECLDQYVLPLADGSGTRFPVGHDTYHVHTQLVLPSNLECSQCVMQWLYNAGNKWGFDYDTQTSGLGYGAQEQFYACADVAISGAAQRLAKPEMTQEQEILEMRAKLDVSVAMGDIEEPILLGEVPTKDKKVDDLVKSEVPNVVV